MKKILIILTFVITSTTTTLLANGGVKQAVTDILQKNKLVKKQVIEKKDDKSNHIENKYSNLPAEHHIEKQNNRINHRRDNEQHDLDKHPIERHEDNHYFGPNHPIEHHDRDHRHIEQHNLDKHPIKRHEDNHYFEHYDIDNYRHPWHHKQIEEVIVLHDFQDDNRIITTIYYPLLNMKTLNQYQVQVMEKQFGKQLTENEIENIEFKIIGYFHPVEIQNTAYSWYHSAKLDYYNGYFIYNSKQYKIEDIDDFFTDEQSQKITDILKEEELKNNDYWFDE